MIKTTKEAYNFIKKTSWVGKSAGLGRMKELLSRLKNPEESLDIVHVAGTNGKGSVCSMLASILTASGCRTGLLTSPHLIQMNERIRIGDETIDDVSLCRTAEEVRQASLGMSEAPTEYEILTAMALLYFKEAGARAAVMEVGLGGEFDSTNAVEKTVLSIITSIGLDHTEILGRSAEEIASAKAGIIKPFVPVISSVSDSGANAVIKKRAEQLSAPFIQTRPEEFEPVNSDLKGTSFKFKGFEREFFLPLAGSYQHGNVSTVMTAVRELRSLGFDISDESIANGLAACSWPARFEVLSEEPVFIVDGAHNPEGVNAALRSLGELGLVPKDGVTFVCGVLADKDFRAMMEEMAPFARKVYTLTPDSKRALDAKKLEALARECGIEAESCADEREAVRKAKKDAGADGTVCFLGSLYLAGRVRKAALEESGSLTVKT